MRYMAFLVLVMCTATLAYQNATLQAVVPNTLMTPVSIAASQFLSYRSAVMAYMASNPTFTGTVQPGQLAAYAPQYSSTFISAYAVSNAVTVYGSGRMITAYAALPAGAVRYAVAQSGNDASIGVASNNTWTSAANGVNASPQPLNTNVPNGDVVAVVNTGT